jgi:FkbM family methyltransferase
MIKRALGWTAIRVASRIPGTKRVLRSAGLRCSQGLFGNRLISIQTDRRRTLRLSHVDESYLAFQLFWRGFSYYEPITRLLLGSLLPPGATFLDIGAHHGFFTLSIGVLLEDVRIIAFEPNPTNFKILEANVAANPLTRVCCESLAISNRDGTAPLYLTGSDMSASLKKGFQSQDTEQIGTVEVRTTGLDSYLNSKRIGAPMVIKVDIEGHEAAFMRGAMETLRRYKPDIVLEVVEEQDPHWVAELKNLGYHFYSITDRGLTEMDSPALVKRFPFLFLNHLLSTRPEAELRTIFHRIEPEVRDINLLDTSKHFRKEDWPLLWCE